ncbi:MAG: glycerol kinase [Calditrichaeota bacterium]|nr:MAG: glycerol kinase [Calditrichota bacterium]
MHILAIDQGTTGTTTILFDEKGQITGQAYREFPQIYPQPGWVEHNPEEIWQTVQATVAELLSQYPVKIVAVGITNQRETTVLWDRRTGKPIHNAIVWQCRRTADFCESLQNQAPLFRQKTGLPLDAYFSGTKIKWLLENVQNCDRENILFGTIDSWLIWKLTNGKVHATDFTNASRTLLFNIHEKKWDEELCDLLDVPLSILPQVKKSAADFGMIQAFPELKNTPIYGVAGDQQTALFGQACFNPGQIKNTYGTGCFIMMNTGNSPITSTNGLITTLAVDGNGEPCYALEGAVFIAGAAIQWLRDELQILKNAADSEAAAMAVENNGGVYLVPAFVGLGAPHWNSQARGTLVGLTRGTNRNHIIRAALEAMAYQTNDVLELIELESGIKTTELAVDGGACSNNFLMQFQADICKKTIVRPRVTESTALGAAYLAGLQSGVWENTAELTELRTIERRFIPEMGKNERTQLVNGWQKAVRQAVVL